MGLLEDEAEVVDEAMKPLDEALRHAEKVMGGHIRDGTLGDEAYEEFLGLVDAAARLPGARQWAPGIEGLRFSATLVYERSMEEVERALQSSLAVMDPERDMQGRMHSVRAAYTTYPELRSYYEAELAALEALPPSELRTELLRSAMARPRTGHDASAE
ncbi:hypothetical protein [Haliangium sp.]|uniref:hypothetical protein n=1 Tax=Haliangium sp. TaxID=2663208 RepID=UPI003D140371